MNRDQIITEAKKQGKTEVETFGGWLPLDLWKPYGVMQTTTVDFYLKNDRIHEQVIDERTRTLFTEPTWVLGVWPLR